MPFLKILFEETNVVEAGLTLLKGKPHFALTSDYIKDVTNYYITGLIITQGGKMKALIVICLIIFIMTFFKNVFRYLAMFFIAPIRNGVVRDLRNKMYKSDGLPLSYYSEEKKGDLMSRMSSDVQEIEWSIMQTLEMIFREPLTIILLFSLMLLISAKLTLYILLLLPIAALFIVFLGKSLKNASRRSKETLGTLISVIEETLGSLKVIKAFSAMTPMQKKFEDINQRTTNNLLMYTANRSQFTSYRNCSNRYFNVYFIHRR